MLLDAGGNCKHIGIEDYIFRRKAQLINKQIV